MKTIKEIRIGSGLTQSQMAQLLQVGRSHFSMAESGKRKLPQEAMEFLEMIDREVLSKPSIVQVPTPEMQLDLKKGLEKFLRSTERKLKTVTNKIAALKKKQQISRDKVHLRYSLYINPDDVKLSAPLVPLVFKDTEAGEEFEQQLFLYGLNREVLWHQAELIRKELEDYELL